MNLRLILSYILLGIFPIYEIGCYRLLWSKKNAVAIRKRNTRMIKYASCAAWLAYINLLISLFGGLPCGVYYFFTLLVTPMSVGPQILRVIILRGLLEQNRMMIEQEKLKLTHKRPNREIFELSVIREDNSGHASSSERLSSNREGSLVHEGTNTLKGKMKEGRKKTEMYLQFTRWGLLFIPTMILALSLFAFSNKDQLLSTKFEECFPEPKLIIYLGRGIGVLIALMALTATILIRHCVDELGIRAEINRNILILFITYVFIFLSSPLEYTDWQALLQSIQQMTLTFSMVVMPCIQAEEFRVSYWKEKRKSMSVPGYGRPIQSNMANKKMSMSRRLSQRDLEANRKRTREATMSLDAGLCILLSTKEGITAFTEHCAREFSVENIMFWCAVNDFRHGVDQLRDPDREGDPDINESDLKEFANDIYSRYIEVESDFQINVSANERQDIKNKLHVNDNVDRNLFNNAQKEIYALMSRDSYPRFLSSKNHDQGLNPQQSRKHYQARRGSVVPAGLPR